jgi:hypothetical protein
VARPTPDPPPVTIAELRFAPVIVVIVIDLQTDDVRAARKDALAGAVTMDIRLGMEYVSMAKLSVRWVGLCWWRAPEWWRGIVEGAFDALS